MNALLYSLILSLLLGLAGCGTSEKTNATLEVSTGFVISSSSFGGGLIITGKNLTTGKSFSQGLTGTRELNIKVNKGKWTFSAIAWDGGANNEPFSGLPYCGRADKEFIRETEVVDLTVTKEKCNDPYFSLGNTESIDATTSTIKQLTHIITCNTFFKTTVSSNSTVSTKIFDSSTPINFCDSLDPNHLDLKSSIKSIRISSINTLDASAAGLKLTTCLPASAGVVTLSEVRLPLGEIPLVLDVFEEPGCVDQLARFPFNNGISIGDNSRFDHALVNATSGMRLALPANELGRAISPFQHLMPSITKEDGSSRFSVAPNSLGTFQFRAGEGENSIVLSYLTDCPTILVGASGVTGPTCVDLGNSVRITFTGSPGSGTLTLDGTTLNIAIEENAMIPRYLTQRKLISLLGTDKESSYSQFFNIYNDDENDKYGSLSAVRQMFRANGAGGVVGLKSLNQTFNQACLEAASDKTVTLFNFKKMVPESYRVIVSNNSLGAPEPFICSSTNAKNPSCPGVNFKKKMIIYDHKVSTLRPTYVLKFNCNDLVGKLEKNDVKIENGIKEENKQIIHWNTNSVTEYLKRFEEMNWVTKYNIVNGTNSIISEEREITRLMTSPSSNFEVWNVLYRSKKNAINYSEELVKTRMKTTSTTQLNYYLTTVAQAGNPEDIFAAGGGNSLPESVAATSVLAFDLNGNYPQNVTTTSTAFDDYSVFFEASTQRVNDETSLNMKTSSLNETAFKDSFGGNFLLNP